MITSARARITDRLLGDDGLSGRLTQLGGEASGVGGLHRRLLLGLGAGGGHLGFDWTGCLLAGKGMRICRCQDTRFSDGRMAGVVVQRRTGRELR